MTADADRPVLVTGGAGFIGANVAAALVARGHRVRVLDDLSTGTPENLAACGPHDFQRGSILDPPLLRDAMQGCTAVWHMAAQVGNVNSLEHPFDDARANGEGTLAVALAATAAGVERLVYSSSAAIFGEPVALPIAEAHPTSPESYYGVSKLTGERYAVAVGKLTGLTVCCLRYFNVYGPGQRYNPYGNVIPIFVERLLADESPVIYGDGEQTRDFVDVRDVVQANLLAGALPVGPPRVFNIGSGTQTTVNQVAELLLDLLERRGRARYVTAPARAGEVRDSVADLSHARAGLGYAPKIDLAMGLRDYVAWYRATVATQKGHTT